MSTCIFCGRPIEPEEAGQPAGNSGYVYCRNCLRHRDAIARGLRAGEDALQSAIDGIVKESAAGDRAVRDAINGIIYQLDPLYEEEELARFEAEKDRDERAKQEAEKKQDRFLMCTAAAGQALPVREYLGVITVHRWAERCYNAQQVDETTRLLMDDLRDRCIAAGADACLGVGLNVSPMQNNELFFFATGTAVKLV